jgi:hypothetical protein
MGIFKNLSKAEIDRFLKANRYGILSMTGEKPYALPMGYMYRRGTILLGLIATGRKMGYLHKKSPVCFTICKPRWETEQLKTPCTSLVIEGLLDEVKNRAYYGIKAPPPENSRLYKIKIATIGARKCSRQPCELFAQKQP